MLIENRAPEFQRADKAGIFPEAGILIGGRLRTSKREKGNKPTTKDIDDFKRVNASTKQEIDELDMSK